MSRFHRFPRWAVSPICVLVMVIVAGLDFSHRWTGLPGTNPSLAEIATIVVSIIKTSPVLVGVVVIIGLMACRGFMRLLGSRALLDIRD